MLWSGGKDSTASIILAHEYSEPLDEIIFTEVMYDNRRGISGENSVHMEFIRKVAMPLFFSWGYQVTILRGERDYLSFFNHVIEKPTKNMDHKGKCFGFPCGKLCGIRRDCKQRPIKEYLSHYAKEEIVTYLGICADEKKRLFSMHKAKEKVSLLEKYGITQKEAGDLCLKYGLLSPAYQYSKRGGCWFCPFAKEKEHAMIKDSMPDIWEEFVSLEERNDVANKKWNPYLGTLRQRDLEIS